jgi:hypothetical protein
MGGGSNPLAANMLYSIIETLNKQDRDFEVHRVGCKDTWGKEGTCVEATSARSAAEKFIEQEYNDLDHELGFGSYKIMPCAESKPKEE